MAALWRYYIAVLERRPVVAKAVSSAVILGGGDVTSQLLLQEESWNYKRFACDSYSPSRKTDTISPRFLRVEKSLDLN